MQAEVICNKKHQLPVVVLEIEGSVEAALIELPLYSWHIYTAFDKINC